MAQNLTYSLELTTEQVRAAISQVKSLLATLDPKINTKGIDKNIIAAGKNGATGIKNEFSSLGLGNLLKSQIIAGLAVQGISSAIGAIGSAIGGAFSKSQELSKLGQKYKVLLGTQELAAQRQQEIIKYASETPFEISEISKADVVLQGFGIRSEKMLRSLGDASAVSGKGFDELALIIGQISQSKSVGNLNQLYSAGVVGKNDLTALGIRFNPKSGEVENSVEELYNAVNTAIEKKFKGGAAALNDTIGGQMSTISDNVTQGFDRVFKGSGLEKGITDLLKGINAGFGTLDLSLLTNSLKNVVDFVGKINFSSFISQGQSLLTNLQPIFNTLQDLIFGAFEKIKNINFGELGKKLTDIFGKIDIAGITNIFDKIKTSIGNALGKIDLNKTIDGLTSFATGIVDLGTKIAGSEIFKATVGTAIDLLVISFDKLTQIDTSFFINALKTIGEGLTAISQNQLAVDIITGLGIALGGLAIIGTVVGFVTPLVSAFTSLWTIIGTVISVFGFLPTLGALVSLAFAPIIAFFAPVTAGFGLIASVVGTVFATISGFVAFVGLIPILIGVALISLVAIFILNFESIKNFTLSFIGAIGTFFTQLGTSISTIISGLWVWLVNAWNVGIAFIVGAVGGFVSKVIGFFTGLWNSTTAIISGLWNTAKNLFFAGVSFVISSVSSFVSNVINFFINLGTGVRNAVTSLWEGAKNIFTTGVNNIKTTIEGMVSTVKEKFNQLKDGAITAITNMIDGAKTTLGNLPKAFTNAANDAKDALLGVLRNIKLPELKFPEIKLPSIPNFGGQNYKGTDFWKGGVTEIAEKGRELFKTPNGIIGMANTRGFMNLPRGTKIWNNAETEAIMNPNQNLDLASATRPQPRANFGNTNSNTTNNNQKTESRVYNNFSNNQSFLDFGLANI